MESSIGIGVISAPSATSPASQKEERMSDIVICMNKKDFDHKMNKFAYDCYWSMGRIPRKFFPECICPDGYNSPEDVVFVVTEKQVVGFIEPIEFNDEANGETIVWNGGADFTYIKPIPCKPFRGFRYRWFEFELENPTPKGGEDE